MFNRLPSAVCAICGRNQRIISRTLAVCLNCIRDNPEKALPWIESARKIARQKFSLPTKPPKAKNGIKCNLCSNECMMGIGDKGFCGLRMNVNGKLKSLSDPEHAILHAYTDPHVTNCCASWFCPAGTGSGYPKYACTPGPERGYSNLAVFFYGCNFDCLFCQNISHKAIELSCTVMGDELVNEVSRNRRYTCVCFFGGSPEPQLPFALNTSRKILEKISNRIVRICFEWNGCGNQELVRQAAETTFKSGGIIKFDLKAFNPNLSLALSGISNRRAFENFEMIAKEYYPERRNLPTLTATTLLVPGYVDRAEVEQIAGFIAEISSDIPYSLLVFHPEFMLNDLPVTPLSQVKECLEAAKKHLKNVNTGNANLL